MRRPGFTLLEVVVAMAILGLALMAIFSLNANAVAAHVYTKKLSVATLLARSKMTDLEQDLYDKPLPSDDEDQTGDFSDEGWPSFSWKARILVPRTDGVTPEQLMSALFNIPIGGGSGQEGGNSSGGLGAGLGALFSGGGGAGGAAAAGGAAGALGALGPMAGLAQGQFQQMLQQLTQVVREVHLTVAWKEGNRTESFDMVTHIVSMGPGSDRNGGAAAAAAATAANNGSGGGYVRSDNGMPVATPTQGPNGRLVDPSDNTPVVTTAEYAAGHPGWSPTGAPGLPGATGVPGVPGIPGLPSMPGQMPFRRIPSLPQPGGGAF